MSDKSFLILERSGQNLQKISSKGKTVLEGVFAEFGKENRNGRVYEEKEYLPHLEYLKKDIANGNLLGELDHPERFEVSLNNASHRITDLWYDQAKRQILGRIEVFEGTPKGQIAKALLEAGVPLSISSRAAGTVNEDKTVQIQQIYTYDIVAKPGFEAAQLHNVNEGVQTRINNLIQKLNESYTNNEKNNISNKLGFVNENLSIIDISDKYPSVKLREEALKLSSNKNNQNNMEKEKNLISEDAIQQWTVQFNQSLNTINERLNKIEESILTGNNNVALAEQVKGIKKYVEDLRSVQESALDWQTEIAQGLNKTAAFSEELAKKSNKHYELTKKIEEAVDHNATMLNGVSDWNAQISESLNNSIDRVEAITAWNTQIAKAINLINEWSEEKAKAINDMHEWVSDIAKHTNHNINYVEKMLGVAISKEEASKLLNYIELVSESKATPELKNEIIEMLSTHTITKEKLNEAKIKGIETLDEVKPMKKQTTDDIKTKDSGVEIDKNKTIVSKIKDIKLKKDATPKELKTISSDGKTIKMAKAKKVKGILTIDATKVIGGKAVAKDAGKGKVATKDQNLKLDVKAEGKLKEEVTINRTEAIKDRSENLKNKLDAIINGLEKERVLDEEVKKEYPFTALLSENERKRFAGLSQTDKEKVSQEVVKVPTTDANIITRLWENALAVSTPKNEEPLYLKAAPKKYREAYDAATDVIKESIKAKSEFFILETQYQINNFWETSGIIQKPTLSLNESVVPAAKISKEDDKQFDSFVSEVGSYMKNRYNN